jgi:hypothetical protein
LLIDILVFILFEVEDKTQKKAVEPQEKPARKRKWGSARSTTQGTTKSKTKRLSSIEFSTESLKVHSIYYISLLQKVYSFLFLI